MLYNHVQLKLEEFDYIDLGSTLYTPAINKSLYPSKRSIANL